MSLNKSWPNLLLPFSLQGCALLKKRQVMLGDGSGSESDLWKSRLSSNSTELCPSDSSQARGLRSWSPSAGATFHGVWWLELGKLGWVSKGQQHLLPFVGRSPHKGGCFHNSLPKIGEQRTLVKSMKVSIGLDLEARWARFTERTVLQWVNALQVSGTQSNSLARSCIDGQRRIRCE